MIESHVEKWDEKKKSEMGNPGHGHSKYEGIGDYDVFKERWTEFPRNKA